MSKWKQLGKDILLPIMISFLSIIGIMLILMTVYLDRSKTPLETSPSLTPFKYLFLATETRAVTLTETPITEDTTSPKSLPPTDLDLSVTLSATDSPASNTPPNGTSVLSIDETLVFIEGIYDDIDDRIVYEGSWVNDLVEGAYGETLFVSTATGDTATFTFVGTQLQIGYLEDSSLGMIGVNIDDTEYPLDQSSGSEWLSPELPYGEHTVLLIHEGGDIVLIDYLNILSQ